MIDASFRSLFPVANNVIYFNHAAVGPLSTRATDAIEKHARDQRDFGALHWRDWYAEDKALRRSAAALIGAEPSEIAILKNTSEGLSFVAEGLRWKAGENVITTDLEFPSNYTPWKRLERRGVECRIVASRDGVYSAEDVEYLIDDNTRLVSVSAVAFHNGFAADLIAIGELCKRRNVLFCVDAIQSVGVVPIDVRAANIAFLSADGHKWMCGPEGAAIFYVAEEHRDRLDPIESGWTNFDRKGKFIGCSIEFLPDSRRFEAGSLNTNGVYGLRAAIDLLLETGISNVHTEVLRLATRLADGLESMFPVATPRPIASGIVAAKPRNNAELLRLHLALEQEKIVCAPREGLLRFSPHAWNSDEEVDRVLAVLHNL